MTTRFFAPPDAFDGDHLTLPPDEARHASRVLRHGAGDEIEVVDGAGGWYRVRLDDVGRDAASGTVLERLREVGEPAQGLTIALGVLKQPARFETFVEKAVELGVTEIVPLLTERSERSRVKRSRLEGILVAAVKQSGRSRLPLLHDAMPFVEALDLAADARIVCHEATGQDAALLRRLPVRGSVAVLVGPEGGFSPSEVAAAEAAGFAAASLGPLRLRAETAALAAAAAVTLHRAAHADA